MLKVEFMMPKENSTVIILFKEILKIKRMIMLLVLILIGCSSIDTSQFEFTTNVVKPKQLEIFNMLNSSYNELKNLVGDTSEVSMVIKIHDNFGNPIIDVTMYPKKDFGWILRDTKVKPNGIFFYDKLPVVIFGESSDKFFTNTKEKVFFEWLKPLPALPQDSIYIPMDFDPPIWSYEYLNNTFVLKNIGWGYSGNVQD